MSIPLSSLNFFLFWPCDTALTVEESQGSFVDAVKNILIVEKVGKRLSEIFFE